MGGRQYPCTKNTECYIADCLPVRCIMCICVQIVKSACKCLQSNSEIELHLEPLKAAHCCCFNPPCSPGRLSTTDHYHFPIRCWTHLHYPTKLIVRGPSVLFANHHQFGLPRLHKDYCFVMYTCSELTDTSPSFVWVHIAASDHIVSNGDISSHIRPHCDFPRSASD